MPIINIPNNLVFNFASNKQRPIIMLAGFCLSIIIGTVIKDINYGTDFKGGIVIEASMKNNTNIDQIRSKLKSALPDKDISIQEISSDNSVIIKTEKLSDNINSDASIQPIKQALSNSVEYKKIEFIGPKVGKELIMNGIKSIIWALLAITVYVCIRFKWQFGVCSILALIHDCLGIIGYFLLSGKEFNEGAIVSILITASYSINDTVIIFDRIRENFVLRKGLSLKEVLNISINETLPRTILTSTTTLLAILMLCIFGGNIIRDFSLPIFVGIFIGSYSSISIAAPLLLCFPSVYNDNNGNNTIDNNRHTVQA